MPISDNSEQSKELTNERVLKGQPYHIKGWKNTTDDTIDIGPPTYDGEVNCMWGRSGQQRRSNREESDDDDSGNLICTMRGNSWESLPYPIIVDSGASASTLLTQPREALGDRGIQSWPELQCSEWTNHHQHRQEGSNINDQRRGY